MFCCKDAIRKNENSVLAKLPEEILNILYVGTEQEIDRLNRYLHMYIELTQRQD